MIPPAKKWKAIEQLSIKGYKAKPLKRKSIPMKNSKMMHLGLPTIRVRGMQALFKLALKSIAETTADPNSYGFIPKRSCADAIQQFHNALSQSKSAQWILEADIKGCFDNINHQWLLQNIPIDKMILQHWKIRSNLLLKNFLTKEGCFYHRKKLKSPISPKVSISLART